MARQPNISIARDDAERLWALLEQGIGRRDQSAVEHLEDEISRARIVEPDALSPQVVRIGSRVRYEDLTSGIERDVRLVWPHEADLDAGRISLLSPIGAALLGLAADQEIEWPLPDRKARVRVLSVAPVSDPAD